MAAKRAATGIQPVLIPAGDQAMAGDLVIPARAHGIVVFAHGSGSSRSSPRNRFVATELQKAGMATLLMDLLTSAEEEIDELSGGRLRFDIDLLAGRVEAASDWVRSNPSTQNLAIGYFGASTGAAAALVAASAWRGKVAAVVSRGGRPDLAAGALSGVRTPTLLIVGGDDREVIELNRQALGRLVCEKRLQLVQGATHLFEEPGALEQVAALAVEWFREHLQ
jgi:putative phosphoribosyl transferase